MHLTDMNHYLPSQRNGWKPRKRKDDSLARFLFILVVLGALFIAWDAMNPQKATAKTIEIVECMTNECICDILLSEGFHNYTQEDEITALCV